MESNNLDLLLAIYRKHVLMDDSIGWDELTDLLHYAICETMGDAEFQDWLEECKP